jgi:hypothetical protein
MRLTAQGEAFGMGPFLPFQDLAATGAVALRLCWHSGPETAAVFWRINGFRARLLVWTVEEWEKMDARPVDAQFHPSGVWCALRLE